MKPLNRLARRIGRLYGCLNRCLRTPPPLRPPQRVFVVGAGFSSQLSGGYYPMMDALGKELLSALPFLSKYCRDDETFDFEIVLTRLDMDIRRQQPGAVRLELEHQIDDLRQFLRKRLSLSEVPNEAKRDAAALCSYLFRRGDAIITFNYDCLLEHTLHGLGTWTPCGGYGGAPGLDPRREYGSTMPANPNGITVLKLHGSVNFGIAQSVRSGEDQWLQVIVDEDLFPGSHAHLGNMPQWPPVTLPSYMKLFGETRTMVHLWHEAAQRVAEADTFVMVGYSMPASDNLSRFLISFCTSGPGIGPHKPLRIGILGGDATEARQIGDTVCRLGRFDTSGTAFEYFGRTGYSALSRFVST
jgi:hypothetical protein